MRVKSTVTTPKYQWGSVNHNSIGVVTSISANSRDVTVDFPMQGDPSSLVSTKKVQMVNDLIKLPFKFPAYKI